MTETIAPWAFVLAVADLDVSAAYYRDVLGFSLFWDDASDWRLAERGAVRLMFGRCPTDDPAADIGSHSWFGYLEVSDVTAFRTEIVDRGAVCSEPAERPYGMREIVVTTVDGHRIAFGEQIARSTAN